MTQEQKTISFNIIPRHISEEYLDKKLQRNEWILLVWLSSIADVYGYVTVNTTALRDDMFPGVKVNSVEQLLRSLRKKRYLHFNNHQGQRGSFRVELDEWFSGKKMRSIAHRFDEDKHISEAEVAGQPQSELTSEPGSEPSHNLRGENQKFFEQKRQLMERFSMDRGNQEVTSRYNDNQIDIEKEKDINELSSPCKSEKKNEKVPTSDFVPQSDEEYKCKEIAIAIKDPYINFTISVLRDEKEGGLNVLENAYADYLDRVRYYERTGTEVRSSAALFNNCVKTAKENKKRDDKKEYLHNKYRGL